MPVGEALSQFPRERTWLLPALQAAQRAEGWLSPETLATVAAHVRVPASERPSSAGRWPNTPSPRSVIAVPPSSRYLRWGNPAR